MDHKGFLADLPAEDLAALTERRDAPGLFRLATLGMLLLGTSTWILTGAPFWGVALVMQGLLLIFLFTLEHECTHKTPFATAPLNEAAGRIAGVVILLPFLWFRHYHFAHHRFTNIPGKDPELEGDARRTTSWGPFLWYLTGIPTWIALFGHLWRSTRGRADDAFLPDRVRPRVIREARWHVALYGLALASLAVTPALFWIWILPLVIGQPMLRLYLMAEHGRCAFVADMFDNTRTTYTHAALRWIAWNMPYHTAHHVLPSVPFHHLPALHARMKPHLKRESDGYLAFTAETLRGLPSPK